MENAVCFPPISMQDAQVLILGSMPGQKSLEKQQYYGHPQNSFWKIMGELFGFDYQVKYEARAEALIQNRIALWDVLQSCIRPGSLDSNIDPESMIINDFESFFEEHPEIEAVYFNGTKAEQLFRRFVISASTDVFASISMTRLPSTSPANAGFSYQQKLNAWKQICD